MLWTLQPINEIMAEKKDKNIKDGKETNPENIKEKETSQEETVDKNTDKDNFDKKSETETKEEDPLEAAQKEIDNLKDKYLRSVAEFDNYRKRTLKEKADLIMNGGEKTITAVLPIIDDIERALSDKNEDPKAIKEGFELIFKKFQKTLESMGVQKIKTTDMDFNTDQMEAIAMVPGMGDDKKGKVIDCVQAGYTMNDKVIRHAKVAVGQ